MNKDTGKTYGYLQGDGYTIRFKKLPTKYTEKNYPPIQRIKFKRPIIDTPFYSNYKNWGF